MTKPNEERLTLSIPEAAALLGISHVSAYKAARNGELPVIYIGKRALVSLPALAEKLAKVNQQTSFHSPDDYLQDVEKTEKRIKAAELRMARARQEGNRINQ